MIHSGWTKRTTPLREPFELAPQLPDGYYAREVNAYFRHVYFGYPDRAMAETDLDTALKLSPDYPDALLAKAFLLLSKSMELNDNSSRTGRSEAARTRLEQALQVHPDAGPLHITLADVRILEGNAHGAAEVTAEALQRGILTPPIHESRLAAFYAAAGRFVEARQVLTRVQGTSTYYADFYIASTWAGIGDERKALQSLRAWQAKMKGRRDQGGLFRWWLRNDPNFKVLRDKGALEPFLTNDGSQSEHRQARLSW